MDLTLIKTQTIYAEWLTDKQLSLDVLRLDEVDNVVSGNKWFKLKYYLHEARVGRFSTVASFGGAWSNHIVAIAYAARSAGLKSIGVIRGEKPAAVSYTLAMAMEYGMDLHFVTREQYRRKEEIQQRLPNESVYWIDEGGYGAAGVKGASEILKTIDVLPYNYFIAAVGTGTMLAGLIVASAASQTIVGISSMKGNYSLEQRVRALIGVQHESKIFDIKHEYHFGGYGRHPPDLITFINDTYHRHHLPLDIIYTGKTFFAIKDMAQKNLFKPGSRILMIHSGGLQGNKSLPDKLLAF